MANGTEAGTIIYTNFLAKYMNFIELYIKFPSGQHHLKQSLGYWYSRVARSCGVSSEIKSSPK